MLSFRRTVVSTCKSLGTVLNHKTFCIYMQNILQGAVVCNIITERRCVTRGCCRSGIRSMCLWRTIVMVNRSTFGCHWLVVSLLATLRARYVASLCKYMSNLHHCNGVALHVQERNGTFVPCSHCLSCDPLCPSWVYCEGCRQPSARFCTGA